MYIYIYIYIISSVTITIISITISIIIIIIITISSSSSSSSSPEFHQKLTGVSPDARPNIEAQHLKGGDIHISASPQVDHVFKRNQGGPEEGGLNIGQHESLNM